MSKKTRQMCFENKLADHNVALASNHYRLPFREKKNVSHEAVEIHSGV
jgi:hypothetical protein